jgi:AraC family transcriptional regulator of arabinose operon
MAWLEQNYSALDMTPAVALEVVTGTVELQVPAPDVYGQARVGRVVMHPGQTRGMPMLSTYQLLFVHQGEAFVSVGGRPPVRLAAGEVLLLRPQDLSQRRTIGRAASPQSWLAAVPEALDGVQLAALDAAPAQAPISEPMRRVQESAIEVARYLSGRGGEPQGEGSGRGGGASRMAGEGHDAVLLPLVVGALMLYVEEARAAGRLVPPARRHPAVEAAREELRRRLNQRLALRDLASAAHVTPEHLVRLFRRELGTTPGRYLWAERLRAGVHLLEHTTLPVGEIAERTGFQTPSHFGRHVRAVLGLRPGDVRRRGPGGALRAGSDAVLEPGRASPGPS